jgi:hypothetical protein
MSKKFYGYDINSPEYSKMESNQKLFLVVLLIALILLILVLIVGTCAYFWGELGAKIAFITLGAVLLILLSWAIVMASINRVSYIYRDAAETIVSFQAADDRGEVMRHLATVVKSGNQLDRTVLSLAGRMANGQAKALVDGQRRQSTQDEQDTVDAQWWNAPDFNEVD